MFPPSSVAAVHRILGPSSLAPVEVVTFAGTSHGFAVRGPPSVLTQRTEAREKVAAFMVSQLASVPRQGAEVVKSSQSESH
jgi:hypothetical protein